MTKNLIFSSIGKKTIMAVTGALLGLFLLGHLAGNATAFWGRATLNAYAERLHSLGFLIHIIEAGLLAVFITHIVTGLILYLENRKARPIPYLVPRKSGPKTWGCRTMPYTGLITLIFLSVHLANFHFNNQGMATADMVKKTLSQPEYGWFYIAALVALALHVSHGFWSMFQSLGLNGSSYDRLLKNGALTAGALIGVLFILIPALALFCNRFLC